MTSNEVRLLKVFFTLCLLIGLTFLYAAGISALSEQNAKITFYAKTISESQKTLDELDKLKASVSTESEHPEISTNKEMNNDLASYVASIKASLVRFGITPNHCSVSGSKAKSVYFSFHATPHQFFTFLKNASDNASNIAIYFISMKKLENNPEYAIEIKARYEN